MCISDAIAAYILGVMERTGNGTAELQRNTLAEELGCVPSQISYVLTSRFTPEKGYIVESRRGGGGYIRVQQCSIPKHGRADDAYVERYWRRTGSRLGPGYIGESFIREMSDNRAGADYGGGPVGQSVPGYTG